MANYVLTSCSTADMPLEFFQQRNIPFVCFHYHLDGKDYPDDLGQTMSFETFYTKVSAGAMPTTSQVNPGEFISFFEPFIREQKDILHLSFSSGLSGAYHSACLARDAIMEKYPNRTILVVDTLAASAGYGLLADLAADMRDQGAGLQEVYQWAEEHKLNIHHWFLSTDLSHLRRGGRISVTSAFVGTKLNICPIINVNVEGKLIPRYKVRGKKHAIAELAHKMEIHAEKGKDYQRKCFISHSACYEDARRLADLIEAAFPQLNGPVVISNVGTVIGSHTGPGTIALFFFGDKRLD